MNNNNDENIHIGELFKQIFGFWKIYVPIGIVCLIAAIIFLLVTPKEYTITSRMQLLSEKQGMMSELKMLKSSGLGGLLGGSASSVNIEDEVMIMLSRKNLMTVIKNNDLQLDITTRRGLKNEVLDVEELPIKMNFPPQFLESLSKPIKVTLDINNGEIVKMKWKSSLFETVDFKNLKLPAVIQLPIGSVALSENLPLNGSYTVTMQPLQKTYEALVEELEIAPVEKMSDILELEHQSSSKQRSAKLLNDLMTQYNYYSKEIKIEDASLNAQFVGARLDTITKELSVLEHGIERYKQANKLASPEDYAKVTYIGTQEVEKSILEAETRLHMVDFVIDYIKDSANEYSAIPVIDEAGEKAIALYNELLLQRQRLLLSSEPNNPSLVLVETQLKEQRKMLLETAISAQNSMKAALVVLRKSDNKIANRIDMFPKQEREYIEMMRQQKIKETIFLFLMQKLQEKELTNSPDEKAGRVVDAAYSSYKHVFPKGSIVLIAAFLIACMLSLIVIGVKIFVFNKK